MSIAGIDDAMSGSSERRLDLADPGGALDGVYELTLETTDLAASERFYAGALGLPVVDRWGADRPAVWLALGRGAFLGLWSVAAGGELAIHGGRGGSHVHFALRVRHGTLSDFAGRLAEAGHETEWRRFDSGNVGLYTTDPDGNVVELTELRVRWDGASDDEPAEGE